MHHQILTAPLSLNSPCKTFCFPLSTEVAQNPLERKEKAANFAHKTWIFVQSGKFVGGLWRVHLQLLFLHLLLK